jgi:hypothetical protein
MVLVELLVAPLWSVVGPCEAATLTVCPSGCDHTEIQHAATVATAGDVIQLLSVTPHTEGDIFITKDLTVEGFGQSTTVIQADAVAGASTVPVFVVVSGATISFSDLVIRHGGGSQGGAISVLDGTAIFDDVTLAINHGSIGGAGYVASGSSLVGYHLTVTGNTASIGGGIASEGSVMLVNSEVSSNEAQTGDGGGINATAGELELNGTLVEWNYVDSAVPSDFVYGPGSTFSATRSRSATASSGTTPAAPTTCTAAGSLCEDLEPLGSRAPKSRPIKDTPEAGSTRRSRTFRSSTRHWRQTRPVAVEACTFRPPLTVHR